ncbi:MAG: hypothetical protein FWG09_01595, partial [Synergistaceae bacterium]|nr:hypothetical protein [Synergistaceae bacterium]
MRKKFWMAALALTACFAAHAIVGIPPAAAAISSTAALPVWNAPHMLVHVENVQEILSRFGSSFTFDLLLGEPARFEIQFESMAQWELMRAAREGLRGQILNFPVRSFSFVRGLMRPDEDTFHGAVRFEEGKREILAKMAALAGDDDADDKFGEFLFSLFGFPASPFEKAARFDVYIEEPNIYKVYMTYKGYPIPGLYGSDWRFFASVEKSGDEYLLLIGSEPEEIARARAALKDEGLRMKAARRGPDGHENFLQINDNVSGEMTSDILYGLSFEHSAPAFLELSFGAAEKGKFEISLRHNLFDIFLGAMSKPAPGWSPDDPGLKFGGGRPWLAGMFSAAATEDDILDLMASISGESRGDVKESMEKSGFSVKALANALRSFGFVLGGEALLGGKSLVPGGYVFISAGEGGAENMRAMQPFVRMFLENSLNIFEETGREGWDVFYTLREEERPMYFWLPLFIGMKDGALLWGVLSP